MTEPVTIREVIDYLKELPDKVRGLYFIRKHMGDKRFRKQADQVEYEKNEILYNYINTLLKNKSPKDKFEAEIDSYFWQEPRPSGNEIYNKIFDNLVEIAKDNPSNKKALGMLSELVASRIGECITADDSSLSDKFHIVFESVPLGISGSATITDKEFDKAAEEFYKPAEDAVESHQKKVPWVDFSNEFALCAGAREIEKDIENLRRMGCTDVVWLSKLEAEKNSLDRQVAIELEKKKGYKIIQDIDVPNSFPPLTDGDRALEEERFKKVRLAYQ